MRPLLPGRRGEPDPQRLGHHVNKVSREFQGQQHPGLFHALGPVMPARADQVLQAGTMPLRPLPGKLADRAAVHTGHPGQVPHSAGDLISVNPSRHQPAIRPALSQIQMRRVRRRHRNEQVIPGGQMRPQRTALPRTLHASMETHISRYCQLIAAE